MVAIDEGGSSANGAAAVARQLAWHGIRAEGQMMKADDRPIAELLSLAAQACNADLLVMGSYSTGPLRQEISAAAPAPYSSMPRCRCSCCVDDEARRSKRSGWMNAIVAASD